MQAESIRLVLEALKEEGVDLYVTLPEEPSVPLTEAAQADPFFQVVPVASEDSGVALCAGRLIPCGLLLRQSTGRSCNSKRKSAPPCSNARRAGCG